MMNRLTGVVAVSLLLLGAVVCAQQPAEATTTKTTEAAAIKAEAENSSRAFVSGDYSTVLDLTYPKVIELVGGKAKALAALEREMKESRDDGLRIISHMVGEPEPSVRAGTKLLAVVPVELKMESRDYSFVQKSFWLAVSTDEGKSWRFIDGSSLNGEVLKMIIPEAVDKIKLPPASPLGMERKPAG